MSKADLVSVIVPVYNVENYIEKCLDSIINQTYENLEIIVVNDGSGDHSYEICKKYENDKRVQLYSKENGGLSSARNYGIEKASGKYIMFVDSDDYLARDMVEYMLNMLNKENCEISICNRIYKYEDNTEYLRFKDNNQIKIMDNEQGMRMLLSFKYFDMAAWAKLYERTLFDNIKFPEGKLCEDYYIMYKLFLGSRRICYSSKPLYFYMQRAGSITKKNKNLDDYIWAAKEQMEYIEKEYPNLIVDGKAAYALSFLTVYNKYYENGGNIKKELVKEYRKNVKLNLKYVIKNRNLRVIRKVQALLFCSNLRIYNFLLKGYKGE